MRRLTDAWFWFPVGVRFTFVFLAAAVALCISINAAVGHWCHSQAEVLQVESQYGFWTSCNYRVDGIWIDSDQYGVVVLGDQP